MSDIEEIDVSDFEPFKTIRTHADCAWAEQGRWVCCAQHSVPLYEGTLPEEKGGQ